MKQTIFLLGGTHTRIIKCEEANCQKAMSLCGGLSALGGGLGVRAERVGDEALM